MATINCDPTQLILYANTLYDAENYKKALKVYLIALKYITNKDHEQKLHHRIGEIYLHHTNSPEHAIAHFNKVIASSSLESNDIRYMYYDSLLSAYALKLDSFGVKQFERIIDEAKEMKEFRWVYHFSLKLVKSYFSHSSFPHSDGLVHIQKAFQYASDNKHEEMKIYLYIFKASLFLQIGELNEMDTLVSQIHEIIRSFEIGKTEFTSVYWGLKVHVLLIEIIHNLVLGHSETLVKQINQAMDILNTKLPDEIELPFDLEWISRDQLYIILFLFAGSCKMVESIPHAVKVFEAGLAHVHEVESNCEPNWLNFLRQQLYSKLFDCSIAECRVAEASILLEKLIACISDNELEDRAALVCIKKAMLVQLEGQDPTEYLQTAFNLSTDKFEKAFCQLTLAQIGICSDQPFDTTPLKTEYSLTESLKASISLLKGVEYLKSEDRHRAKALVLNALKTANGVLQNTQLKYLSLMVLGHLYIGVDLTQSERMFASAYLLTKKDGNTLCSYTLGILLSDAFKASKKMDKYKLQIEQNHKDAAKLEENKIEVRIK